MWRLQTKKQGLSRKPKAECALFQGLFVESDNRLCEVGGVKDVIFFFLNVRFVRHHRYWGNQQLTNKHFASLLFCLFFAHDNRTLFRKSALAPTKDQKYQLRLFLSGMEIILHMTHAVRVQPLCYFCCCLLTTTPHVVSSACSRCAWLTSVSVLFSLSAVVFTVFTVKPAPTTVGRGASSRKRTHKEPVVLPRLQHLVSAAVIVSPVTALVLWTQVLPGSASFLFILANAMKKPQRPPSKWMNTYLF